MSLTLNEEQLELRAVVREFFGKRCHEQDVRRLMGTSPGYDPQVWKQLNEQIGALGLAVAEEHGGAGAGHVELGIVLEEAGRALYSGPLLSTALVIEAITASGDLEAMQDHLPRLVAGLTGAVALTENAGRWSPRDIGTRAEHSGDRWLLSGDKRHVIDGANAELIVVVAHIDAEPAVFLVEHNAQGLSTAAIPTVDQTRQQAHLRFDRTPARLLGTVVQGPALARRIQDAAAVLLAAEQVGGAERTLRLAVDYAGIRVQYGRPIGSFQAIKHMCADMLTEVEAARSAVYDGLRALSQRPPDLPYAAAAAKIFCSEVFFSAAKSCIQIHGAIGFTWEHPAHLYLKRAQSSHMIFGTPAWHREQLAAMLIAAPEPSRHQTSETSFDSEDEAAFRAEVRDWLQENLLGGFAEHPGVGSADDAEFWELRLRWEKKLAAAGWLGITWPVEYGGRGAPLAYEIIFNEESARAGAPYRVGVHGQDLFGPTLLMHGSDAQKARFLPKILATEEFWGQGFSEPEAGSDLASLRTRARLEGDEWVVDGHKIWTTFGQYADWLYVLCRTDPQQTRHKGISLLVIPVDQPGVEINPIRNLSGAVEFCEIFLNGARTKADAVVGQVHDGWRVAMSALQVERGSLLMPVQLGFERQIDQALQIARTRDIPAGLQDRLVEAWVTVRLMRATNERTIAEVRAGRTPGPQATTSKLFASTRHQQLLELASEVLAEDATVTNEDYELHPLMRAFLLSRAETIYGGSSQVQRNIIAERLLSMPREQRPS